MFCSGTDPVPRLHQLITCLKTSHPGYGSLQMILLVPHHGGRRWQFSTTRRFLLQFFFVRASVVSYVALVLSSYVKGKFVIVCEQMRTSRLIEPSHGRSTSTKLCHAQSSYAPVRPSTTKLCHAQPLYVPVRPSNGHSAALNRNFSTGNCSVECLSRIRCQVAKPWHIQCRNWRAEAWLSLRSQE